MCNVGDVSHQHKYVDTYITENQSGTAIFRFWLHGIANIKPFWRVSVSVQYACFEGLKSYNSFYQFWIAERTWKREFLTFVYILWICIEHLLYGYSVLLWFFLFECLATNKQSASESTPHICIFSPWNTAKYFHL